MPPPQFLPTPSARRATTTQFPPLTGVSEFLPTPSARRATGFFCVKRQIVLISTHALREEGDRWYIDLCKRRLISTHALREEGDRKEQYVLPNILGFLPTPSARRATNATKIQELGWNDFYPRPPRGGRHGIADLGNTVNRFLPTPSARRATIGLRYYEEHRDISTHALREEGDGREDGRMTIIQRISTHALREEGDNRSPFVPCSRMIFLPTPSARRATRRRVPHVHVLAISTHALREEGDKYVVGILARALISTHALREEGDCSTQRPKASSLPFLPTPSARRATAHVPQLADLPVISTHALREEGDEAHRRSCLFLVISTHALREEGDGSGPFG